MVRFVRYFLILSAVIGFSLGFGPAASAATASQALTISIVGPDAGIMGPDGQPHEAFVPSSVIVKAGTPVQITFINYSHAEHNFVQPQLNLDLVIPAAGTRVRLATTTVSFMPTKRGVYRWFCSLPCDEEHGMWAMGRGYGGPGKEGFMAGNIVVR
ncbi:MAG: cupredoxin domain-containing protein [Vulcanimicrobiaceae bacterium]|jgi:plastocyanin